MSMLEVSHLAYSFPKGKAVLRDVSFSLEKGTITLLSGVNGAGKSVLLKCLKGLLKPQGGTITIDGVECTDDTKRRLVAIGLVFQDAKTQIVGHTVRKDIQFGMENLGIEKSEQERRLAELGKMLQLDERWNDSPRTLSGGTQRRLAIAGVLAMQPKIVMMDEPFTGLDLRGVRQVLASLRELRKKGTTILIVCHEAEKMLAETDHLLLLEKGTIIADGKPKELLKTIEAHDIHIPPIPFEAMTWG